MDERTTVGIDLAKEVFAVCVLNAAGAVVERLPLRRTAFERWLAGSTAPCTVAMEACSSAHHWGRWLAARGHSVRLIAPAFVTPFRKSGKNDAHDAEAIAIAACQPTMRFVPVKTIEAQAILSWHRARQGWIEERTGLYNRLRGLLAQFGVVLPRAADRLRAALPGLSADPVLPAPLRALLLEGIDQLRALDARIARCDAEVAAHARAEPAARRLRDILGIGALTSSAVLATVPQVAAFRNARQFAAWIGITPRQYSSGGKTQLGRISRRGDGYLRCLLVQGARSTLQAALRADPAKATPQQRWIIELYARKGYHKTLVAIANKHARIIWALLARGAEFDPEHAAKHGAARRAPAQPAAVLTTAAA
jgi:transposase